MIECKVDIIVGNTTINRTSIKIQQIHVSWGLQWRRFKNLCINLPFCNQWKKYI